MEDEINIEGVAYRFIDTAGIRHTKDFVESIGIKKTFQNIEKAQLVLHLIDASKIELLQGKISELEEKYPAKKILTIINKNYSGFKGANAIICTRIRKYTNYIIICSRLSKHI